MNGEHSKPVGKTIQKKKPIRNPFLLFAKEVRARGAFKNMSAATKEAAKQWRQMSNGEKQRYKDEAAKAPVPTEIPVFYRLNEHQLGATNRQYLYLFKAAINDYVENCVDQIKAGQEILEVDP